MTTREKTKNFKRPVRKKVLVFNLNTPHQERHNKTAEWKRKFATLYGRVRAMLNGARVPQDLRNGLWTECANTATKNENMVVSGDMKAPRFDKFYGRSPPLRKKFENLW